MSPADAPRPPGRGRAGNQRGAGESVRQTVTPTGSFQ